MTYPRLGLVRELPNDDGAFSISMDDNEEKNLREICDCLLCMQERKGWGAKVIDRIFRDLTDTFPT